MLPVLPDCQVETLPAWCAQALGLTPGHCYQTYRVPADGNCFFTSMEIVCRTEDRQYTREQPRHEVANSVYESKPHIQDVLKTWSEIASGLVEECKGKGPRLDRETRQSLTEYGHMLPLAHQQFPLQAQTLDQVARFMNTRQYWADEFAVRQMQLLLQVRLMIIRQEASGQVRFDSAIGDHKSLDQAYCPQGYVVLLLSGKHYQPVLVHGKGYFRLEDLPVHLAKRFGIQQIAVCSPVVMAEPVVGLVPVPH